MHEISQLKRVLEIIFVIHLTSTCINYSNIIPLLLNLVQKVRKFWLLPILYDCRWPTLTEKAKIQSDDNLKISRAFIY